MIYGAAIATFYGILRAVMRLSGTAVQVPEGRRLSLFIPHNFGVWMLGGVCTVMVHVNQQQPECF